MLDGPALARLRVALARAGVENAALHALMIEHQAEIARGRYEPARNSDPVGLRRPPPIGG
jgi:hypothetical protein